MPSTIADLTDIDPARAAQRIAEFDPSDLADEVRGLPLAQLNLLAAQADRAVLIIDKMLTTIPAYVPVDKLAGILGVVGFELSDGADLVLDRTVRWRGTTVEDGSDATEWDVIIRSSPSDFLRLLAGHANAGLLAIEGQLEIEGDAELALALSGTLAGADDSDHSIDPGAMDPADVGASVKAVSDQTLARVMAGPVGPIVLAEVFHRLPDHVNKRKAARLTTTAVFKLTGGPTVERYVVRMVNGVATVETGETADRNTTISMTSADFLKLATGNLNAVKAGLQGRIKVSGDKAAAITLGRAMETPKPRK
ncbi:SCP2 sterol-binding domain-containing protein [Rudaeicoccus suwonensis]|uniref:Putative sterol carrier protein n=1 Tax=Rudaeicoccus suwonensis TaxID=657409 RepID=A0A561EB48_9MICO|nr:SCP2 sterol-binding domain-containing protein [Rudaeicoccus suwonensis]TWE12830.1 putative sterol carrier protein [Rudaeicoccus suwonensis]